MKLENELDEISLIVTFPLDWSGWLYANHTTYNNLSDQLWYPKSWCASLSLRRGAASPLGSFHNGQVGGIDWYLANISSPIYPSTSKKQRSDYHLDSKIGKRLGSLGICSQIRWDYPLNLSISLSGGKETNQDSPSNGEWTGKSSSLKSSEL